MLVVVALWARAAVIAAARAGLLARLALRRPLASRRVPWEAAIVALAVLLLAWQLLVALVLPPFAFDALTYHLTIVATWLQHGNLDPTTLSPLLRAIRPTRS